MANDQTKAEFISLITSIVLQYGIPFAIKMIQTWGVDGDVTLNDIKALGEKIKKDEPFLQV